MRNFVPVKRAKWFFGVVVVAFAAVVMASCSATKFVPDGDYMLQSVRVKSEPKGFDVASLAPYVRQKENSRWFSLMKIPLGVYSLSGRDTTKWLNRMLQRIGEQPVIFDTALAVSTCRDLQTAMRNMGYLHAEVDLKTKVKGKKLKAVYTLRPGAPYDIRDIFYDIRDEQIDSILRTEDRGQLLREGDPFKVSTLDAERKRITTFLMNRGYYRFNKDFISYTADSSRYSKEIDLTLHLQKYRANNDEQPTEHPRYRIRNVNFLSGNTAEQGERIPLRRRVLENNTAIREGAYFSSADLQKTYNNFGRLQAVKYTNIKFTEVPDSNLLDCDVQVSMNKPSVIAFQPEGTNTAGDLGAAASLALCRRSEPLRYGLAVTDGEGWIRAFIEKPDWPHVVTDLVNTGIYVLSPRAVAAIPADRPADFARDLFPALLRQGERLLGVRLQGYWTDIGTPLSYYQCCVDALEGRLALECDPAFRASPTDAAADAPGEGVCFDVPCPDRAEVMGVLSEQLQDLSPDYADGLCLRGINYALRIAPLAATAALRVSVSSPDTEFARALALSAGEMITALGR